MLSNPKAQRIFVTQLFVWDILMSQVMSFPILSIGLTCLLCVFSIKLSLLSSMLQFTTSPTLQQFFAASITEGSTFHLHPIVSGSVFLIFYGIAVFAATLLMRFTLGRWLVRKLQKRIPSSIRI